MLLLVLLGVAAAGGKGGPTIELAVGSGSGAGPAFTIVVDGATWLSATNGPSLCIAGVPIALSSRSRRPDSGTDAVGNWSGTTVGFGTAGTTLVEHTFKRYAALPEVRPLRSRQRCPHGVQQRRATPPPVLTGALILCYPYVRMPWRVQAAVLTARFVHAVNTTGCGGIDTVAAEALVTSLEHPPTKHPPSGLRLRGG